MSGRERAVHQAWTAPQHPAPNHLIAPRDVLIVAHHEHMAGGAAARDRSGRR